MQEHTALGACVFLGAHVSTLLLVIAFLHVATARAALLNYSTTPSLKTHWIACMCWSR